MLVTPHPFDRKEVWVAACVAGGPVLIVNIEHQVMLRGLTHGFIDPCDVLLSSDINETDLDTSDAPLLIERKENIALGGDLAAIDVEPHSDAMLFGVVDDPGKVER